MLGDTAHARATLSLSLSPLTLSRRLSRRVGAFHPTSRAHTRTREYTHTHVHGGSDDWHVCARSTEEDGSSGGTRMSGPGEPVALMVRPAAGRRACATTAWLGLTARAERSAFGAGAISAGHASNAEDHQDPRRRRVPGGPGLGVATNFCSYRGRLRALLRRRTRTSRLPAVRARQPDGTQPRDGARTRPDRSAGRPGSDQEHQNTVDRASPPVSVRNCMVEVRSGDRRPSRRGRTWV